MPIKTNDFSNYQPAKRNESYKAQGNLKIVTLPSGEDCPFRQLVREWVIACKANGLSPKTIEDYQSKIFKFWWWWNDGTRYADTVGKHPASVTTKHAREFVAYLREPQLRRWGIVKPGNNQSKQTLSPVSVNSYGRAVKVFFNWLAQEGEIDDTPFKKSVKFGVKGQERTQVVKRLETSGLDKIFDYLLRPDRLLTFLGRRDLAIFALLLDGGIRRGELLSIQEKDLDIERNRVLVRGKTGERWAMFRGECAQTLRAYMGLRAVHNPFGKDELWLTHDGQAVSYYGFASILRRVERATDIDFHAHMLRHTFASIMAEQGIDPFALKNLLGHTSITTTQIYIHQSPEALSEAHRTRSPLGNLEAGRQLRRRPGRPKQNI